MNVLVVGSGGREHALCWKLRQSPILKDLYCLPGNGGTAAVASNIAVGVDDIAGIKKTVQEHNIDLVIVGPELPLTLGLVDALESLDCLVFGPTKAAAEIEGSKNFAKEIMQGAGIPTAGYRLFTSALEAKRSLLAHPFPKPVVIKADGLASGKGVFIVDNRADTDAAIDSVFGDLGSDKVVVEDFLEGVEASFIVATDGERIVPLAPSHDYKRLFDGQSGPNTGGMGTVSPSPHLSEAHQEWVLKNVMAPAIKQLASAGRPFCGFLYAGLMIPDNGLPMVLEFNARLGDPETQVILRRMESDLLKLILQLLDKDSQIDPVEWKNQVAVCVVMAAAGYPDKPRKGDTIDLSAVSESESVVIFHAGTTLDSKGKILSAGGRVLNVTSLAENVSVARDEAYSACAEIIFPGSHYRRDIGE